MAKPRKLPENVLMATLRWNFPGIRPTLSFHFGGSAPEDVTVWVTTFKIWSHI